MNRRNLCFVVLGNFSNFTSFAMCDGVHISCCVKFLIPLGFSCVLIDIEFKLLLLVLSLNIAL